MYGSGDVTFFDRLAPLYERLMPAADAAALERGLARADRPIERVLDVAGGTGRAARSLDAEAVVIDAAPGMVRGAGELGLPAVVGDAGRLPVRDAAVDAVVVVDALHHLPNQRAAVAEAYRVLRPGGVVVVRDFDPRTPLGRLLVAGERLVGFDSTFTGSADLARFLEDADFDASVVDSGFQYTVVGTKREGH